VGNNPLSYTDPSGFSRWTKWRRPLFSLVAAVAVPWAAGELFLANVGVGEIGTYAVGSIGSEAAGLTATGQAIANVAGGMAAGGVSGGNVQQSGPNWPELARFKIDAMPASLKSGQTGPI